MVIFLFLIFALVTLEGLGIGNIHYFTPFIYLLVPGLIFIYASAKKIRIVFPPKATLIYSLFIFLTAISALLFSVDKQTSLELTLFYIALFLIFILFWNIKIDEHQWLKLLVLTSFVLIGDSVILHFFGNNLFIKKLVPLRDLQLVYPIFSFHNHLGDFLGLVLIGALYLFTKEKKKIFLLVFLLTLPFFIMAFSRSAYLALVLTLVFFLLSTRKNKITGIITILAVIVVSVFVTFKVKPYYSLDSIFSGRPEFIVQSLKSFWEKPLFGFGPGNFYYASLKNSLHFYDTTVYAHNIFLELLVDSGLPAAIFFGIFILLIFINALKNQSLFSLSFLYLLINFQTDDTYRIFGLLVLFLITGAFTYREEKTGASLDIFGLLALTPIVGLFLITTSNTLLAAGQPELAAKVYPLNKMAYQVTIAQGSRKSAKMATQLYTIAPDDLPDLITLANFYEQTGDKTRQLQMLTDAYVIQKTLDFDVVKRIYLLKAKLQSPSAARQFIYQTLTYIKEKVPSWFITDDYRKNIAEFCQKYEKVICQKSGWE